MGTSEAALVQLLTLKFLCISTPETLLHVTLKRRAEISGDIFACLSRYFRLSCKNLTITAVTLGFSTTIGNIRQGSLSILELVWG